jgi:hypothetical protein
MNAFVVFGLMSVTFSLFLPNRDGQVMSMVGGFFIAEVRGVVFSVSADSEG